MSKQSSLVISLKGMRGKNPREFIPPHLIDLGLDENDLNVADCVMTLKRFDQDGLILIKEDNKEYKRDIRLFEFRFSLRSPLPKSFLPIKKDYLLTKEGGSPLDQDNFFITFIDMLDYCGQNEIKLKFDIKHKLRQK